MPSSVWVSALTSQLAMRPASAADEMEVPLDCPVLRVLGEDGLVVARHVSRDDARELVREAALAAVLVRGPDHDERLLCQLAGAAAAYRCGVLDEAALSGEPSLPAPHTTVMAFSSKRRRAWNQGSVLGQSVARPYRGLAYCPREPITE